MLNSIKRLLALLVIGTMLILPFFGLYPINIDANIVGSITGESANDAFGFAISNAGDVNGDGIDDVIVGAPDYNSTNGAVYIFFGGKSIDLDLSASNANITIYGPETGASSNSKFGYSVSNAGDMNNDGYNDVIIGAPDSQNAYIFLGYDYSSSQFTLTYQNANVTLNGSAQNGFGHSVSYAGDINNDTYEDFMVSDPLYDQTGPITSEGRVYIFYGNTLLPSMVSYFNANVTLKGYNKNDYFGWDISFAGDVNNDGVGDIIIGAPYYSSSANQDDDGAAYIYYGGGWLETTIPPIGPSSANQTFYGNDKSYFGWAVSCADDINNDNYDDVLIGAPLYDSGRGYAYVYYGGNPMDSNIDITLIGESTGDNFGCSVTSIGDYDNDSKFDDFAVGAANANGRGKAYVFYGDYLIPNFVSASNANNILCGDDPGCDFGHCISSAGNINNGTSGVDKIIIGAPYYDDPVAGAKTGKVFFYACTMWIPIVIELLEGWSFQDESPTSINDTLKLSIKDGNWAPTNVTGYADEFYSTGPDPDWWDGVTVKFDLSSYDPTEYDAILKFYAQNEEPGCNDSENHYAVYDNYKNITDEDAPPDTPPVNGYPSLTEPLPDDGTVYECWYKYRIPDSWWDKGMNWFTIRVWDGRIDFVNLILVSTKIKTLYLHDDPTESTVPSIPDQMNTTPPSSNTSLNITLDAETKESHSWMLTPEFATEFHIAGVIDLVLWVSNTGNKDTSITIKLMDYTGSNFIEIAETEYFLGHEMDFATRVPIELTAIDHILNKGNKLILNVTATGPTPGPAENVTIYFNSSATNNSFINLPTDTVINIAWVKTTTPTGIENTTFTVGNKLKVHTNITDPFGSYDICGAKITITAPDNTILVDNQSMILELIDTDAPSAWKIYNFTFNNPTVPGIYTVKINAIESNGVTDQETIVYFLEPGPLNELIISPGSSLLIANGTDTSNITIKIYDQFGNPIPGLSSVINLKLDDGSGSFGTITDCGNGTYNFTFTSPTKCEPDAKVNISIGTFYNTTIITLQPGPLFNLIITPTPITIIAGQSQAFKANGYDEFNNNVSLVGGTIWSSTVGTFTSTGSNSADFNAQTQVANGFVNATIGVIAGCAVVNIIPDNLVRVSVSPNSIDVIVNTGQTFTVVGYDKYNNNIELTSTVWSTNVGTISEKTNSNAKFKAQQQVSSGCLVVSQGSFSDSADINVIPDSLDHIIVTPDPVNVTAGGTQEFTAEGYDMFGNIVLINPVWTSNVGYMAGSTLNAQTQVAKGCVNALVGDKFGSVEVTIIPDALDRIVITPNSVIIEAGGTRQFSALGYDQFNNIVAIEPIWTTNIGIMAGCNLTAQETTTTGFVNVTASNVTSSCGVTVIPGPLHHMVAAPENVVVMAGAHQVFTAMGYDIYENMVEINPIWNTNIGQMSGNTLFAQITVGAGIVSATYSGINCYANVTIISGELDYIFIVPQFVDVITGHQQEFTAFGYDMYNNIISINPEWSTDVGTMLDNVLYAKDLPGTGSVTATVTLNTTLDDIVGIANVNVILDNISGRPKIIGQIPDQHRWEDCSPWALYLTPYESDAEDSGGNLKWFVTGEDKTLYTLSGENSDDDTLKFTPVPNAHGSNKITLWLMDSGGNLDHQTIWVNLTPINDKPIIYGVPDLILHYDDPYTFNYEPYIYDVETPNNGLIIFTAENTESSYTTVTGLNITFEYPKSMMGQDVFVTIIVSDGVANGEDIIKVSITDDWVPKLSRQLPDVTLYEGTTIENVFDLDDYFFDPDQDCLYYSYGETHVSVTINDDHTVNIISNSEWFGKDTATFRAEDPVGALAEDTVIITVIPINDPPTISGVPDLIVHYEYDYEFDLASYIDDNDNETEELRVHTSDPDYIQFVENNPMVMIVNYPENMNGMIKPVTITVSDGLISAYQIINIKISDDYPPEVYKSLPDIEFNEDSELLRIFNLDNFFFDLDGDWLYYSYGNTNIVITINEDNTVDFTANPNWFGSETVTFRAEDPIGALAEDAIVVTVLPVNDAPNIITIPEQIGEVGEMWTLDIGLYLEDVDNEITELDIEVDNEFVVISGMKLVFYSDRATVQEVTINVSDGEKNASRSFIITFTKGENLVRLSDVISFGILVVLIAMIGGTFYIYKKYRGKYKVEDVFLIYNDGTLISHQTSRRWENADDDLISAMFTAIQDFVKNSLASSAIANPPRSSLSTTFSISDSPYNSENVPKTHEWRIKQLRLENHDIFIERGKHVYIAVVFTGSAGWNLYFKIKDIMKDIDNNYSDILKNWSGNMMKLIELENIIDPLMTMGRSNRKE